MAKKSNRSKKCNSVNKTHKINSDKKGIDLEGLGIVGDVIEFGAEVVSNGMDLIPDGLGESIVEGFSNGAEIAGDLLDGVGDVAGDVIELVAENAGDILEVVVEGIGDILS